MRHGSLRPSPGPGASGNDGGRQVNLRPEALGVQREVDLLRQAIDEPMGLGEGGAALEGGAAQQQLVGPRDLGGPDHPDDLFDQGC